MTTSNKKSFEDWMNRKWRPFVAWTYILICIVDFVIFPVAWSYIQAKFGGDIKNAWMPLTIQGAGLFHLAMGAILGISAWSRGQEKITDMTYRNRNYDNRYSERSYNNNYKTNNRLLDRPRQPMDDEI